MQCCWACSPDYSYDDEDDVSGETDSYLRQSVENLAGETTEYDYDHHGRLEDAVTSDSGGTIFDWHYEYDSRSNRTQEVFNGATTTYSYNAVSQLTSYTDSTGTTSFTYDGNGSQLTETDAASFGYDVANHAVEVTPDGQPTLDYTYNGATQQRLVEAGPVDLNESLLGLTAIDVPGVATIAATRTDTGMAIGQRIATPLGTDRYYFLTDGDGSVVAVTDSSGNIVNEYEYEPFGQAIPSRTTVGVVSIWKWQGGMNDTNSDTYKFGIRYYQPEIGRWTQTDPVEGQLPYAYSNNDPINQSDVTGMFSWGEFFGHVADLSSTVSLTSTTICLGTGGSAVTACGLGRWSGHVSTGASTAEAVAECAGGDDCGEALVGAGVNWLSFGTGAAGYDAAAWFIDGVGSAL